LNYAQFQAIATGNLVQIFTFDGSGNKELQGGAEVGHHRIGENMDAKHKKTKRWIRSARTVSQLNVTLLAAEFTDIAYRIALNRRLEENWLEFQLNLWRTTTQKRDRQQNYLDLL